MAPWKEARALVKSALPPNLRLRSAGNRIKLVDIQVRHGATIASFKLVDGPHKTRAPHEVALEIDQFLAWHETVEYVKELEADNG